MRCRRDSPSSQTHTSTVTNPSVRPLWKLMLWFWGSTWRHSHGWEFHLSRPERIFLTGLIKDAAFWGKGGCRATARTLCTFGQLRVHPDSRIRELGPERYIHLFTQNIPMNINGSPVFLSVPRFVISDKRLSFGWSFYGPLPLSNSLIPVFFFSYVPGLMIPPSTVLQNRLKWIIIYTKPVIKRTKTNQPNDNDPHSPNGDGPSLRGRHS